MTYYAIRRGKKPGIYTTWNAAREQIYKYPGAVFKSFEEREQAEEYLTAQDGPQEPPNAQDLPIAYIDGSYSKANGLYSFGGFINVGGQFHTIQGTGNNEAYLKERNIAGELLGTLQVMTEAARLNIRELILIYDYEGIREYMTGSWRAKTKLARHYQRAARDLTEAVTVYYRHVESHTGERGNELADLLAKEAAGAKLRKKDLKALETYRAEPAAYFLQAEEPGTRMTDGP